MGYHRAIMTSLKRSAPVAIAVLGAVGLAVFLVGRSQDNAPAAPQEAKTDASTAAPSLVLLDGVWHLGDTAEYDVELRATQQGAMMGAPSGPPSQQTPTMGSFHVKGRLVLTADEVSSEVLALRLSFRNVEEASGRVAESALVEGGDKSLPGEAWLVFQGAERELRFAASIPGKTSVFLELVANQLPLLPLAQGDRRERTTWGVANSSYSKIDETHWSRLRPTYSDVSVVPNPTTLTVQSRASIELNELFIVALTHRETIEARSAQRNVEVEETFSMTLVSQGQGAALMPVPEQNELNREEIAAANLLDTRINGLTEAQFLAYLEGFDSNAGDLSEMLWRMSGLLHKQPMLAYKMKPYFVASTASHEQKSVILDMLAQVGHRQAQEVLRDLLDEPATRRDAGYIQYLQRMSFLTEPDEESVRFVEDTRRQSSGLANDAWSYVEGALAGRLMRTGHEEKGRAINQRLLSELSRAQGDAEADRLKAIGNAGLPENNAAVAAHVRSPSVSARRAVAIALVHVPSAENERVLLILAQDPDVTVRVSALSTLAQWDVDAARLSAVAGLIASDKIPGDSFGPVLGMCQKAVHELPAQILSMLETMLSKSIDSADVRNGLSALRNQARELSAGSQ